MGYKVIKLDDFTDTSQLPPFNHDIKWRIVTDKPPRRKVLYRQHPVRTSNTAENPSAGKKPDQHVNTLAGLVRANSNSISNSNKKQKRSALSSRSTSPSSSPSTSDKEEMMYEDTDAGLSQAGNHDETL